MVDIGDGLGWGAVLRPETTDIALGGNETNFPGKQLSQLASRDKYLRDLVDALNSKLTTSQGSPGLDFFSINASAFSSGRLTLQSGTPVPTSDRIGANAATLYFTPYNGNTIGLWSGTAWGIWEFAELSLSLSGASANTNHDIFLYNNNGTLTLERIAWTNDTTRATALVAQNGVWVRSGAPTRRYLGTVRIGATAGQSEQSFGRTAVTGGSHAKWFVWNANNRVAVSLATFELTTSWTYRGSLRSRNNSNNNRISFVVGQTAEAIQATSTAVSSTSTTTIGDRRYSGLGLDSTTAIANGCSAGFSNRNVNGTFFQMVATYANFVAPGFHYLQELERAENSVAGNTSTWFGTDEDQYGTTAVIWA